MRFSPRRRTRMGGPSGSGSSAEINAGIQYSRIRFPIGVPRPTRQSSSLSSLESMCASSPSSCAAVQPPEDLPGQVDLPGGVERHAPEGPGGESLSAPRSRRGRRGCAEGTPTAPGTPLPNPRKPSRADYLVEEFWVRRAAVSTAGQTASPARRPSTAARSPRTVAANLRCPHRTEGAKARGHLPGIVVRWRGRAGMLAMADYVRGHRSPRRCRSVRMLPTLVDCSCSPPLRRNSSSIAVVASGTICKTSIAASRFANEASHETHRLQGIDVRLLRYADRLGNRHSRCIRAAGRTLEVEGVARTDSHCICRARARAGSADAAPEVLAVARDHIQAHRRELIDARTVGRVRGVWSVIAELARVSGYGGRAEISETALPAIRSLERRQRKLLVHEPHLEVQFDGVMTAEDIGSYKPSSRNFEYLSDRLAGHGIRKDRIL